MIDAQCTYKVWAMDQEEPHILEPVNSAIINQFGQLIFYIEGRIVHAFAKDTWHTVELIDVKPPRGAQEACFGFADRVVADVHSAASAVAEVQPDD